MIRIIDGKVKFPENNVISFFQNFSLYKRVPNKILFSLEKKNSDSFDFSNEFENELISIHKTEFSAREIHILEGLDA